jgi:hypothetical protein
MVADYDYLTDYITTGELLTLDHLNRSILKPSRPQDLFFRGGSCSSVAVRGRSRRARIPSSNWRSERADISISSSCRIEDCVSDAIGLEIIVNW